MSDIAGLREERDKAITERDNINETISAIVGVAERFGWNGIENSKFLLSFLEDEFNELKQLRELLEGSTVRLTSPDLYAELEPEDWNAIVAALHDWCDHATNDDHFEARENLTKRLESALDRRNCPICGGDDCQCVEAAHEFEEEAIEDQPTTQEQKVRTLLSTAQQQVRPVIKQEVGGEPITKDIPNLRLTAEAWECLCPCHQGGECERCPTCCNLPRGES